MLGCALVQQGHRKALALGGHLQEHIVDQDDHLVDIPDICHFFLYGQNLWKIKFTPKFTQ